MYQTFALKAAMAPPHLSATAYVVNPWYTSVPVFGPVMSFSRTDPSIPVEPDPCRASEIGEPPSPVPLVAVKLHVSAGLAFERKTVPTRTSVPSAERSARKAAAGSPKDEVRC